MSKTESTAINQLISIARTSRPVVDPAADLFKAAPPKPLAVAPQATERIPQAQIQAKANEIKKASLPPPRNAVGTPPPQMLTLQRKPLPPASGTRMDTPLPAPMPEGSNSSPWFESDALADALEPGFTEQVKRQRTATFKLVRRLALPLVGFVALGAAVGTYIALNSRDKAKIAPVEVKLTPEPAPAVVAPPPPKPMILSQPVEDVAPPVATAKLIDVRIDSQPLGATVMIVDRGKTEFLGKTPIATSLDSAHGYDLVFSIEGRPSQMAHLDPTQQQKIDVAFPVVAAPVVHREAPAPVVVAHHDEPKPVVAETGEGTLMISSKPPCQISVDGSPTGLTTPQRAIALPAGHHTVTLVSAEDPSVKRTVSVEINANKPTKVIQDLMK